MGLNLPNLHHNYSDLPHIPLSPPTHAKNLQEDTKKLTILVYLTKQADYLEVKYGIQSASGLNIYWEGGSIAPNSRRAGAPELETFPDLVIISLHLAVYLCS